MKRSNFKLFSVDISVDLSARGVISKSSGLVAGVVVGSAGLAAMGSAVAIPAVVTTVVTNYVVQGVYETVTDSIAISDDVKNLASKTSDTIVVNCKNSYSKIKSFISKKVVDRVDQE